MAGKKTYLGKYRGTVISSLDPESIGRIQVSVPDVSALVPTTWALPCMPAAGLGSGVYIVPTPGSGVWVEFEHGDPNLPIWTGCYWGSIAEVPPMALLSVPEDPAMVLQTPLGATLLLTDFPGPTGGVLLRSPNGASITINETGIIIQNGAGATLSMIGPTILLETTSGASIALAGPSVAINEIALVVT